MRNENYDYRKQQAREERYPAWPLMACACCLACALSCCSSLPGTTSRSTIEFSRTLTIFAELTWIDIEVGRRTGRTQAVSKSASFLAK